MFEQKVRGKNKKSVMKQNLKETTLKEEGVDNSVYTGGKHNGSYATEIGLCLLFQEVYLIREREKSRGKGKKPFLRGIGNTEEKSTERKNAQTVWKGWDPEGTESIEVRRRCAPSLLLGNKGTFASMVPHTSQPTSVQTESEITMGQLGMENRSQR